MAYFLFHRFSITKWIHLNDGDEGLTNFFRRVRDVLRPAGKFVLEPQPWESYGKAKRGNAQLKENAARIQLKPEEFPRVLEETGFQRVGTYVVVDGAQGELDPASGTGQS
jgi:7SK snRNA methylphosphate capping enzyme